MFKKTAFWTNFSTNQLYLKMLCIFLIVVFNERYNWIFNSLVVIWIFLWGQVYNVYLFTMPLLHFMTTLTRMLNRRWLFYKCLLNKDTIDNRKSFLLSFNQCQIFRFLSCVVQSICSNDICTIAEKKIYDKSHCSVKIFKIVAVYKIINW